MTEPAPAPLHDAHRQALLDGVYPDMLACVRCGLCLTSCPTYLLTQHEAESPRGRIAMLRGVTEGRLAPTPDLLAHQDTCLVCDACSAVCPVGIHMDPLQVAARAALGPRRVGRRRRLAERVGLRLVLARPSVLRLVVRLLWLYQRLGMRRLARLIGPLRRADALLPPLPSTFVAPRGERHAPTPSATAAPVEVSFFAGCIMTTALAPIDRATVRVLRRAGFAVTNTAGQGCCGALHAHAGDRDTALALARRNIAAFEGDGAAPIVVNSAGCGAMLRHYPRLLRDEPAWAARAVAFAARVRDLSVVLAGRPLAMRPLDATVTYQDACHLAHAQRISREPRTLLRAIPGVTLQEMPESALCCGSAGLYNLTHAATARDLGHRKLDNVRSTGATVVVTGNPGCLLHLRALAAERGDAVSVTHLAELLDEVTAP
ncbi:MAG: (Fe-S)-binding protein [Dehalococcoidia bacterium]